MFRVYVSVETYSERYFDSFEVNAGNERAARIKAEHMIMSRHGRQLVNLQITDVSRI